MQVGECPFIGSLSRLGEVRSWPKVPVATHGRISFYNNHG